MAYFRVTDIWFERIGTKAGAKVRFEKLDLISKSWWAEKDSPTDTTNIKAGAGNGFLIEPESMQCQACCEPSLRVYQEAWMCLRPSCAMFWSSPPASLTFHPDFLNSRTAPDPDLLPHYSLVPDLLATIDEHGDDASLSRIAWKGIICPRCAKCISRRFWRGWKCTDEAAMTPEQRCSACKFEKTVAIKPTSLRSVVDDFELGPIKRTLFFDPRFAVPEIDDRSLCPYRKLTYCLFGAGTVAHFISNRAINSRAKRPNDLFRQLQVSDLGLRRYPLQQSVGESARPGSSHV